MKKKILIGGLLVLFSGLGIGYYMYSKKVPTLEDATVDFIVEANELILEFEADEAAALKKYEDKVIEVTGTIISVKNDTTNSNILLEAEESMMMDVVSCSFKYPQPDHIEKGQKAIIRGRCQGYNMGAILNNCLIIE
jgi:hypothetical protein